MTAGKTDETSVMDDVFSKDSDMGADSAVPGAKEAAAPAPEVPEQPKPEQTIVKADEVKDDEVPIQGRDPHTGRFVPVGELVAERKRLKAERDAEAKRVAEWEAKAKSYEEHIGRMQVQFEQLSRQPTQQEQPPDFFENPEFHLSRISSGIEQKFQYQLDNMRANFSERMAVQQHGREKVDAAVGAAKAARINQHFMRAADPYEALMKWYADEQVKAEIGNDFDGFKKRLMDEATQKALANLKQNGLQPQQTQQQRFPSSLADQTATGEQMAALTEESVMDSVFARRRRA